MGTDKWGRGNEERARVKAGYNRIPVSCDHTLERLHLARSDEVFIGTHDLLSLQE